MDKPREGQAAKRRKRYVIFTVIGLAVIALITVGLSKLEPAAPSVDKQTLWIDTVHRGPMLRQVRGPGTLVPVEIRWVAAPVEGRVEALPFLPGVTVKPDTVLIEMTSPELEQNLADSESALKAAQADYDNLKAQLATQVLNQQSQVTLAESQAAQAKLQAEADQTLAKDGLIPQLKTKLSTLQSVQLEKQHLIEKDKFLKNESGAQAQLAAQQAKVQQSRDLYELRRRQVESLKVRSGIPGVLQELPVQVGQRVPAGTNLARVGRPERLKAQLRIPETQAKDVTVGQTASIDTRNGIVNGRVIRLDPSVREGTVTVDVALDGELPKGARPDLTVDGTIEIERLPDVLYVGRPTNGSAQSKIELFRLSPDGRTAERVQVQIGRTSVNTVEILSGLKVGDQVILSDTTAQDGFNKIRLTS
ncbi:MAG TPA: HlyD family efflux transporter periplasmic adaptor subunit [Thermoanaerobaculia bacterium]